MTGKCAKEIEEKMEIPSCFKGLKPGWQWSRQSDQNKYEVQIFP
jgi:hypothetical protein